MIDMSGFYFLVILLFCKGYDPADADAPWSTPPNVYPRAQKVAENSPAVFTCVSYIPGADITWFQSGRQLKGGEDDVTIRRINDVTSVLRIDQAQIKKHKKAYSCRVEFEGRFEDIRVNLKVMTPKRLHKNFPHITPVRSGDELMLPSTDPNTIRMKCESFANKKSIPTWRWIKDDLIDLTVDDGSDDDRIDVTDDGELVIEEVRASDSGRYMCVATNNRGSSYGTPVQVTVQQGPSIPRGCVDDLGVRSDFGETYNRQGDLCTNCTCIEGVGLRCQSVSCIPKYCPPGQRRVKNEEKCCEYSCEPDAEHNTEAGTCLDRDGVKVASGQRYKPEEDPCLQCMCDNGRVGRCMMVACSAPLCDEYISSRDICCNYTCLPMPPEPSEIEGNTRDCRDHKGVFIPEGEMYQPDLSDPCKTCECINGKTGFCTMVVCDEPTCENYTLIPGTCCGFECHDEETESVEIDLDGGCRNHDGTFVGNGEPYHPRADMCVICTCSDGYPTLCRSIECAPPGPMPDNVEKVLGRIFMQQIGSNKAFVQWKIPQKYEGKLSNLTVFCFKNSLTTRPSEVINIGDRPYAILNDLDPNFEYHVMVNGTLGEGKAFMSSQPVSFSLDGRGRSSFVLSDAVGQVFESRGSIDYTGYSLPRKFEPVVRTADVKIILNTESFHRVEITRYNESPCMDQHCGLLRFYVYTMEGESKNVLSLMFTNEQDFSWAKSHL